MQKKFCQQDWYHKLFPFLYRSMPLLPPSTRWSSPSRTTATRHSSQKWPGSSEPSLTILCPQKTLFIWRGERGFHRHKNCKERSSSRDPTKETRYHGIIVGSFWGIQFLWFSRIVNWPQKLNPWNKHYCACQRKPNLQYLLCNCIITVIFFINKLQVKPGTAKKAHRLVSMTQYCMQSLGHKSVVSQTSWFYSVTRWCLSQRAASPPSNRQP